MRSPPRSCSHERLIDPIHWPSLSYMPGVIRYTGEQADERLGGGEAGRDEGGEGGGGLGIMEHSAGMKHLHDSSAEGSIWGLNGKLLKHTLALVML